MAKATKKEEQITKIVLKFEQEGKIKSKTINLNQIKANDTNSCGGLEQTCIDGKLYCIKQTMLGPIFIPTGKEC